TAVSPLSLHDALPIYVIRRTFARIVGAYSCGIITPNQLIALRDPFGFRPLCIGYIPLPGQPAHVVASETCALDTVRATFVREVRSEEHTSELQSPYDL